MESNFNEFPKVTKKEWLDKIEKEYRGKKSFHDLELKLSDDLVISPYVHSEDNIEPVHISNFPKEQKPGIILEDWMKEEDVLAFLEAGISSLFIRENYHFDPSNYPLIHWNLLNVFVEDEKIYEALKKVEAVKEENVYLINALQKPLSLPAMYSKELSTDDFARRIRNQVKENIVRVQIGDHLLFQIGVLRGILDYAQKIGNHIQLLAFCTATESYEEEGLITTTTQSLSARLGGVAHVFNPSMPGQSKFDIYKAMVHNLLDMESKMQELSDPLSGSYYVENITRQVSKLLLG